MTKSRSPPPGTIELVIPKDQALDSYHLSILFNNRLYPAENSLSVVREFGVQPVLADIQPSEFDRPRDKVRLELIGEHFATENPGDNTIEVNGRTSDSPVDWQKSCEKSGWKTNGQEGPANAKGLVHGVVKATQITLCDVSLPRQGLWTAAVRLGPQISQSRTVRIYGWSRWHIILFSLAVVGAAAILVMTLLSFQQNYQIGTEKYGYFRALFLDPETDTYSLSKYQFYLWTAAALFSYAYLALSKIFIQGEPGLPDVPGTLPGIIAIGAGTSIGAEVVSSVRGSKGSGEERLSPSDFVTSGGVAAPERVQMLLWTTFGVLGFCIAAAKPHPGKIGGVPTVPEALLYLMGLSSAGYLGGKLARKPGPVINEISVTPALPDNALGTTPAATPKAADISQSAAAAQQVLVLLKTELTSLTAANAPNACKAAQDAVRSLEDAVAAAADFGRTGDAAAVIKNAENSANAADQSAQLAASEFDRLSRSAPPDPGAETARQAAEIAQRAATAGQTLTSGVSQTLGAAQATSPAATPPAVATKRAIELRGSNLSIDATFEISGLELPFRMLKNSQGLHGPDLIARAEDTGLANMGRQISLTMIPSELSPDDRARYDSWFGTTNAKLNLTIVNPDGQKSVISFSVSPRTAQAKVPGAPAQPSTTVAGAAGTAPAQPVPRPQPPAH